jgi:hypothetical protein
MSGFTRVMQSVLKRPQKYSQTLDYNDCGIHREQPTLSHFNFMEKYMFKKSLIAAALAVAATGSFAQVYVEGAFGQATVNESWAGASNKKTSTGNKFAIGYDIDKTWSAELMVINFGKATGTTASTTAEAKVSGTGVAGYWNTGNDQWGFRVGLNLISNKNAENYTGSAVPNASTGNTALGLGIGGSYKFTDTLALTFGIDTTTFKGLGAGSTTQTGGASLLSVGLRAKF